MQTCLRHALLVSQSKCVWIWHSICCKLCPAIPSLVAWCVLKGWLSAQLVMQFRVAVVVQVLFDGCCTGLALKIKLSLSNSAPQTQPLSRWPCGCSSTAGQPAHPPSLGRKPTPPLHHLEGRAQPCSTPCQALKGVRGCVRRAGAAMTAHTSHPWRHPRGWQGARAIHPPHPHPLEPLTLKTGLRNLPTHTSPARSGVTVEVHTPLPRDPPCHVAFAVCEFAVCVSLPCVCARTHPPP